MQNNPRYIVIHCSDVPEKTQWDQFASINTYHRDSRGFPRSSLGFYVGYHYLITGGKEYVCKRDFEEGAHCNQLQDGVSMNFQSIGVCVGFDGDVELPSKVHMDLLKGRVRLLQMQYGISNDRIKFHRDFQPAKTCPGVLFTRRYYDEYDGIKPVSPPQFTPEPKPRSEAEKQAAIIALSKQVSLLQQLVDSLTRLFASRKQLGMSEKHPEWYESTAGPQVSMTLKAIAGLTLPALKSAFGVEIGAEWLDGLIDAALIAGFAIWALVGHIRAKQTLGARIDTLRGQVSSLGGTPQ